MDFGLLADYWGKMKENENRDKYLYFTRELKKAMENVGDGDTNCNWCTWNDSQELSKRTRGVRKWRTSGDHQNCSIVEFKQNTEKNPGDLKRLVVTQTSVKVLQLTVVWKTLKEYYNDLHRMVGKFWKKLKFNYTTKCRNQNPSWRIRPLNYLGFWETDRSPYPGLTTRTCDN